MNDVNTQCSRCEVSHNTLAEDTHSQCLKCGDIWLSPSQIEKMKEIGFIWVRTAGSRTPVIDPEEFRSSKLTTKYSAKTIRRDYYGKVDVKDD